MRDIVFRRSSTLPPGGFLARPTSVIAYGDSGPLVHWVVYALAIETDPGFIWTDIRLPTDVPPAEDPLARQVVPAGQMNVVRPIDLLPTPSASRGSGASASSEPSHPATVRQMGDFLRLPLHTQRLLSGAPKGDHPIVLVLSNSQRMVDQYPTDRVAPVVRAIVEAGTVLFVTYTGGSPEGRAAFDTILKVEGRGPSDWKRAALHVERAPPGSPFRAGANVPLAHLEPVARVLNRSLG